MSKAVKLILMTVLFCAWLSPNLFAGETVRLTSGEWKPFISEKLKH